MPTSVVGLCKRVVEKSVFRTVVGAMAYSAIGPAVLTRRAYTSFDR